MFRAHVSRSIIALTTTAAGVLGTSAALDAAPSWQVFQITTGSDLDRPPDVSGTTYVWQRTKANGDQVIMLWREGDTAPTQISATTKEFLPRVDQNRVLWESNASGGDYEIRLWDNGILSTITNNTNHDRAPDIRGACRVWRVDNSYWLLDDGVQPVQVTTDVPGAAVGDHARLGGDWLAWEATNGAYRDIYLWRNGGVERLTTNGYDDLQPDTDGQTVVWHAPSGPGGTYEIMKWTPAGGVEHVTDNAVGDGNPSVFGDVIVFARSDGNDSEIFFRYLGVDYQVTNNDFTDADPEIDGNRIAWVGWDSGAQHIYYAVIDGLDGGEVAGACCVALSCQVVTVTQCGNAGGAFLGEETLCNLDSCGAGPAETWYTFQHDSQRTGRTMAVVPANPVRLWSLFVGTGTPPISPVVGPDGGIIAAANGQRAISVNPEGSLRWEQRVFDGNLFGSATVRADGNLFLPIANLVKKMNGTDGAEFCRFYANPRYPVALDSDGNFYVPTGNNVTKVDAACVALWTFTGTEPVQSHVALAPDGGVYVARRFGLVKLDGGAGTELWSYATALDGVGAPAVATDGTVYLHAEPNLLIALNAYGAEQWALSLTGLTNAEAAPPAIGPDGSIYVVNRTESALMPTLVAVSPAGVELWRYSEPILSGGTLLPPAVDGAGTVLFPTFTGDMVALSVTDGSELWRITLPGGATINTAPAIGGDGTLYVTTSDGFLAAYGAGCPEIPPADVPFSFREVARENQVIDSLTIGQFKAFELHADGRVTFHAQIGNETASFTEQPGGGFDVIKRGTMIGTYEIDSAEMPRFDDAGNRYLAAQVVNIGSATFFNDTLFVADRPDGNPLIQLQAYAEWRYVDHDESGHMLVFGRRSTAENDSIFRIDTSTAAIAPVLVSGATLGGVLIDDLMPDSVDGFADDGVLVTRASPGGAFAIVTQSDLIAHTGDTIDGVAITSPRTPRRNARGLIYYFSTETILSRETNGTDARVIGVDDTVAGYPIIDIPSHAINDLDDLAFRALLIGGNGTFLNGIPVAVEGVTAINGLRVVSVTDLLGPGDEVSLNAQREVALVVQRETEPPSLWVATLTAFDLDSDGDVDGNDYALISGCFNIDPLTCECLSRADADRSGVVDCTDWGEFRRTWTGPPILPPVSAFCDLDCNLNGVADDLDISLGTSGDCNHNAVPDECDLANGTLTDLNGNGEPDQCECPASAAPSAQSILSAAGAPVPSVKNRFLSFLGGNAGQQQAVRVKFVNLPGAFSALNGTTAWVGLPAAASELPGKGFSDPIGAEATFNVARVVTAPVYADWSTFGVVHVYDERIIPSRKAGANPLEPAVYEIHLVTDGCDVGAEASFSPPLTLTNPRWGDVASLASGQFRAPDGSVDVTADVLAVLAKFSNAAGAPIKARAEIVGTGAGGPQGLVTGKIDISDVLAVLGAFSGGSYPFPPPP